MTLCITTQAVAETLYVRPEGGSYGAEDGTSYANAFDGFEDMVWGAGAGQIGAGDTLIVCGTFSTITLQAKRDGSAGSPITIDGDCSGQGDLSRAVIDGTVSSMNATMPQLSNIWEVGVGETGVGYTYITFTHFELKMEVASGNIHHGLKIRATSAPDTVDRTVNTFVVIDDVTVHGVGTAGSGYSQTCVNGRGSNTRITNSTIYDCPSDGIYWEGNNNEFSYLDISNVDTQTGTPDGDTIQFGGAAGIQNTGNWIHHNTLDCRGNNCKQALVMSSDSDLTVDNLVEFNSLYGGGAVLNWNPGGGTIRNNLLYSTLGGQNNAVDVGVLFIQEQTGTGVAQNPITVYGNLIVGEAGVYKYGIFANPSGMAAAHTYNIWNNTIIGFYDTGILCSTGGSVLTCNVSNNIIYTQDGLYAFLFGSGMAGTIRKNNIWYGVGAKNAPGTFADNSTGDLNVDPLLMDPSITVGPTPVGSPAGDATGSATRGDHRTKAGSPARRAGVSGYTCMDVRGRPCYPDSPDIGAYQATSGDPANTRTAR